MRIKEKEKRLTLNEHDDDDDDDDIERFVDNFIGAFSIAEFCVASKDGLF